MSVATCVKGLGKRSENSAKSISNMLLADLSVQVLERKASLDTVPKDLRKMVSKVVKNVQKELPGLDVVTTKAHVRHVKKLLHVSKEDVQRQIYTIEERKQALWLGMTRKMSVAQISRTMGIPSSTVQAIAAFHHEQKQARAVRIGNPASNCLNPDSTTGCCVTADLLATLQLTGENRAAKKDAAAQAKLRAQDKAAQLRAVNRSNTEHLLDIARSDPAGWMSLNNELMKSACVVLLGRDLKGGAKKQDRIAALTPVVAAALHEGMPPLEAANEAHGGERIYDEGEDMVVEGIPAAHGEASVDYQSDSDDELHMDLF